VIVSAREEESVSGCTTDLCSVCTSLQCSIFSPLRSLPRIHLCPSHSDNLNTHTHTHTSYTATLSSPDKCVLFFYFLSCPASSCVLLSCLTILTPLYLPCTSTLNVSVCVRERVCVCSLCVCVCVCVCMVLVKASEKGTGLELF